MERGFGKRLLQADAAIVMLLDESDFIGMHFAVRKNKQRSENLSMIHTPLELRITHLSSRTMAYMEVRTVDAFIISKRIVSVSITHRVTTKRVAVAVAGSSSKAALWNCGSVVTYQFDIASGSHECMTALDLEVQLVYPTSFKLEGKTSDHM
ncbi:hypothetical protein Tco_1517802 [Tanacetum coccineum]